MFRTTTDFKIGKLSNLENEVFEITEENSYLNFHVEDMLDNNKYSLDFISIIPFEDMLKFNLNEHINFIKYVDDSDIVFGKNGIYDLNAEIQMDIMRYLSNSFLLLIKFKTHDDLVGHLELSFSVETLK